MQFKSTEFENFMSYRKEKFPFEDGLILIAGENGVGKTTIWDSVSWCLFGKTIREFTGDEVINRQVKKNCAVHVKFKHKSYNYTVSRYRKHDDFGSRFLVEMRGTITRDNRTVEMGTVDQTQNWLIDQLGIDFDLFRCTILFGQEEKFNFIDETNLEQKKILSKIMRVSFQTYQQATKDRLKELKDQEADIERKLSVLNSHLGDPAEKYADDIENWEAKHKEEVDELDSEIRDIAVAIKAIEQKLDDKDLPKSIETLKRREAYLIEINARIEKRMKISGALIAEIFSVKKDLKRHEDLAEAGKCPTCEQDVDQGDCKKMVAELSQSLKVLMEKNSRLLTDIDDLRDKKASMEDRKENLKNSIREQKQDAIDLTRDTENFRRRKVALAQLHKETNPWRAKVEEEREKQAEIAAKIEELEGETEELKEKRPYLEFWVKAFGDDGIKSFIFDLICSGLTSKANVYLNTLTGGEVSVAFDTQKTLKSGEVREKFDCQVITGGESVPYHTYSGGEKRRISLAVDMALSDIMSDQYGSKFNVVCFDEQDSYLDDKGLQSYLGLLKELSKQKTVYVIAHDSAFKASFDEVVEVKKIGGASQIC